MTFSPPAYADILSAIIADVQSRVVITANGVPIQPDFSVGSGLLTFSEVLAFIADMFNSSLVQVDGTLRLKSATGQDLLDIVSLIAVSKILGLQATGPIKMSRNVVTSDAVQIPANSTVLANDSQGNPTIEILTVAGVGQLQSSQGQPAGIAGTVPGGAASAWVLGQLADSGTAGNIGAGQVALLGDAIPGIDTVSNPPTATPGAPSVALHGAGNGVTYQYQIVAHGQMPGQLTTASATGQTTNGPTTLNGTNYNVITWADVDDETGFDVLKNTGTPSVPIWSLLATVAEGVTSYNDQGGATTAYAYPTANTTNAFTGGTDDETDDALRARAPTMLGADATSTTAAITAAVAAISGVTTVFIQDAGVNGQAAGTAAVSVIGSSNPLSAGTAAAITTAIATEKALGIQVSWSQLTPVPINIAYTVQSASTVSQPSSLVPLIAASLSGYFAGQQLGAAVSFSGVVGAIMAVQGVQSLSALVMTRTSDSTTYNLTDVPAVGGTVYDLGTLTATVT